MGKRRIAALVLLFVLVSLAVWLFSMKPEARTVLYGFLLGRGQAGAVPAMEG